ncbi:polyprenyl synthetase family protein [Actinomadura sp. B10D3]|uniref:polyprenyl synthetase family protein n=1 Tax=Actinomadura sp. B10D3 TaxID=3153557 RepID=UPI00325EFE51
MPTSEPEGPPPPLREFRTGVVGRIRELVATLPAPLGQATAPLTDNPGKCLRSTLLGACARFGQHDPSRAVRLGAVVELLHLASLLHDDVVDRAAVRRGRPAAHLASGNEMAVLAGLAVMALAGMEAADLGGGVDAAVAAAVTDLSYGEMLDVERAFDTGFGLPGYLELAERKTGALFRLSCVLGAAEAGLGDTGRRALGRFGAELGIAFQIIDDCRDLEPSAADKPSGTDHMLGLFGAPTLCALREDHDRELTALLLAPTLASRDLPSVRRLVLARDGVAAAMEIARHRRARALEALGGLDPAVHGEARDLLVRASAPAWRIP